MSGAAAERTAATVRFYRTVGASARRRRVPRQQYPKHLEREYLRALLKFVDALEVAVAPVVAELPRLVAMARFERERYDAGEGKKAGELVRAAAERLAAGITQVDLERLAREFAVRTATWQRVQILKQTRAAFGVDVQVGDEALPNILDNFVGENVALVRSLPAEAAARLERLLTREVAAATPHPQIAKMIEGELGIARRRAAVIARDQVGKLYGQVNQARQRSIGVGRYVWRGVMDRRERPHHVEREGEIYRWDEPPFDGHPGEPILCRCVAEPYLLDILDEV